MKKRTGRKLAFGLVMSLIIQSLPTFSIGEVELFTSFEEIPVMADDTTGTPTPTTDAATGTPAPTTAAATSTPAPTADPNATPTPEVIPEFFMVDPNAQQIKNGQLLELTQLSQKDDKMTIGITSSLTYFPEGTHVEWQPYNHDIIKMTIDKSNGAYTVTLEPVGPGYSTLSAVISYGGRDYLLHCQIHVPLELQTSSSDRKVNHGDDNFGMLDQLKAGETEYNKALQLATKEDTSHAAYTHYIPLFQYVDYADGLNSNSDKTYNGGKLMDTLPALKWTSSNPQVATVNEYGYIEAVGAGYTTIRVETTTLDNTGKCDFKEYRLVVAPTAYEQGKSSTHSGNFETRVTATSVTFITNAVQASTLFWELYKDSTTEGEKLDIENNKYMQVDISEIGNGVTLSNMKAGIYYLRARSSEEFDFLNTRIKHLQIRIVVPIIISTNPIIMNVGDYYDVLGSANLPFKELFSYRITDTAGDPSDIAKVSQGVVSALAEGSGMVRLYYQSDKDIFGNTDSNYTDSELSEMFAGSAVKTEEVDLDGDGTKEQVPYFEIPLTVIDGIALNTTMATMYTGSTLQLQLNTSNNIVGINWSSSDESVIKVDEEGLVTAVAAGNAVVTAKQVIHGVTKVATCKIRVIDTVTSITLDPTVKELGIGDLLTINATVEPKLNTVSLHWVSSDVNVVTIEQSGDLSATVKAIAGGTAVVSAINQDNVVVGSCLITVHQPIVSITLSQTKVTIPLTNKQFQLYATVKPEEAKEEELVWKSTDTSIITVDQYGMVTLKKAGTASIICSSKEDGNVSAICNVTVTKAVTGIKLDQTSLNMYVGESFRMTYVITPTDAADVSVTWISTNPTVATVDAKGLVTARSVGQTSIILKTSDGGYMAICSVNVGRTATAVRLDVSELTLNVDDYYMLETTITPADSTEATLIWESSDKSVAVVSNRGKVTAKSAGVTVIMAKTLSGSTAYCTVTVQQGVTGIKLNEEEATIRVEEKLELEATLTPKNATITTVKWESTNTKVAKVDEDGEVTGQSAGVAVITCTSDDGGYVAYCVVIVEPKEVFMEDLTVAPEEYLLGVGKTFQLTATIKPEETTTKTLEWASSDESVVTVDERGRIRGISVGEALITCYSTDGSELEAYCNVEVCYQISDISLNYDYLDMVEGESVTLEARIEPANATYGVIWESADPEVAVVNRSTGKVTALKEGKTTISATADDSGKVTTLCYVNVKKPVSTKTISVSESEVVMIPGESQTVSFTILPANHTDEYIWSSDNPVVASVNSKTGLIKANMMGTANITIMADSGAKATVTVYVVGLSKTNLTLQQYSSTIISLEVYGASKSDLLVKWYSDNERIAEVANGKITARALGSTTVYAVVNGRSLACKVKVEKVRD